MTESGMSNRAGSEANSSALTPAPTNASARSPTTFDDGVTFTSRPEYRDRRRRSSPRSARTGRPARARWPAGAGSTAGRPGSRGDTPGRSARADPDSKGAYTFRSASQYGSRSHTAASDSPVSYSVCAAAATIELQRGLAGGARQRRRGAVDGAGAGLPGRQIGGQLTARGVVGVHVHRQVEPAAQRADQRGGGLRPQQTRPCP